MTKGSFFLLLEDSCAGELSLDVVSRLKTTLFDEDDEVKDHWSKSVGFFAFERSLFLREVGAFLDVCGKISCCAKVSVTILFETRDLSKVNGPTVQHLY